MNSDHQTEVPSGLPGEDPYRVAFELADVGKSVTRLTGEITVNQAFCNMLGYTREELQGKHWQALTHPDDLESNRTIRDQLLQGTKDSVCFNKRYIHKNGSHISADTHITLYRNAEGDPLYFITTVADINKRKQSEETLTEDNKTMHLIFDEAPIGMVIVDLNKKFLHCNKAFCAFLGYSFCELKNKTYKDITYADDLKTGTEEIQAILSGRMWTAGLQKRYVRSDGCIVWGEATVTLVRDDDGQPLFFLSLIQDITARKNMEEEAHQQQAVCQSIIDKADVHLVYLDREFNFLMVNAAYAAGCKKTPLELLGRNHFDFYPHEENEQIFIQVRDTGRAVSFKDKPFVFPDQPERGMTYWDWTLSPVFDECGTVRGLVFSLIETTYRKRLEDDLARIAREWEATFDASNDAFWILDRDFRIVRTNKKAEAMLHCAAADLIGKHCWEIVHQTSGPVSYCPHVAAAKSLHREKMELQIGENWFDVIADPLLDDSGGHTGVVHIISDITERKRMERKTETALQALREQELQYHHLADAGPALIWSSGPDKLCTYFNEPWLRFTGRTLDREKGDGWISGVHPEDVDRCVKIYNNAFDRREPFDREYRLRDAEGVYRWIRDLGTPNYNSQGEFLGYIGHCFDVSEQKEAAEEVLRLNRELEQKVLERTIELQKTIQNLEELNRVFVGRELRMAQLKTRIEELERQNASGNHTGQTGDRHISRPESLQK